MSDLLERCVEAYWAPEMGPRGLRSTDRMARAIEIIALEIRCWAPEKSTAKICHLAINEVADRLLEQAQNVLSPSSNPHDHA